MLAIIIGCLFLGGNGQPQGIVPERGIVVNTWEFLAATHDELSNNARQILLLRKEMENMLNDYSAQQQMWISAQVQLEHDNHLLEKRITALASELQTATPVPSEIMVTQEQAKSTKQQIQDAEDTLHMLENARERERTLQAGEMKRQSVVLQQLSTERSLAERQAAQQVSAGLLAQQQLQHEQVVLGYQRANQIAQGQHALGEAQARYTAAKQVHDELMTEFSRVSHQVQPKSHFLNLGEIRQHAAQARDEVSALRANLAAHGPQCHRELTMRQSILEQEEHKVQQMRDNIGQQCNRAEAQFAALVPVHTRCMQMHSQKEKHMQ